MNPQYDPGMEELNTGTLRHRFPKHYHKKTKRDQPATNGKFCLDCGKQGYGSEAAARDTIGTVARKGLLTEVGSFAIHPYLCHHGWWHIGRNIKVIKKFEEFFKKSAPIVPHILLCSADHSISNKTVLESKGI